MIVLEILGRIFVEILFEGIVISFFRFIGKCIDYFKIKLFGNKKPVNRLKQLEKKLLFKKIVLTQELNSKLKPGQNGVILEIIDEKKVFAEFYDNHGRQIEWENELVLEIEINQFKFKE